MTGANPWRYDDAWILVSLPMKGMASVCEILSPADHHNHSVPNPDELAEILARLVASGIAQAQDGRFGASFQGRAIREGATESGGYDLIVEVRDRLQAVPRVEGPPVASPEELARGYRHYGDPLWRRLRRRL